MSFHGFQVSPRVVSTVVEINSESVEGRPGVNTEMRLREQEKERVSLSLSVLSDLSVTDITVSQLESIFQNLNHGLMIREIEILDVLEIDHDMRSHIWNLFVLNGRHLRLFILE